MANTPLFMTHHAPVGAWSSLTFGLPGRGVSIDHEDFEVHDSADLLVALSHGSGKTLALPFVSTTHVSDYEATHSRAADAASSSYRDRWSFLNPSDIRRTMTACIDEFATDRLTLRVYTPHPAIPNPKRSGYPQFSIVPGVLLELVIDNTHSDEPANAFIGLGYRGKGRIRPMDWSSIGRLCGVGLSSQWGLAAIPQKDEIYTIRDNHVAEHVETGAPAMHNGGNEGGILIKVPARQSRTVHLAFGFYHGGYATQGIEGSYYYNRFFPDLETVCNFILKNVARIKESCDVFDKRVATLIPSEEKRAVFAQGLRAYNANTQIIESNGIPYYSVSEGQFNWRNTLDLAVDQMPWELYRNPWVVRNVFDLYSAHYSYRDELVFPNDAEPTKLHPGGLSFAHDVGSYTVYSPAGTSGYEQAERTGTYSFLTREELLNGVYLLTGYALMSDDEPWSRTRLATARELLDSMEARDSYDESKRDGILKGESSIVGVKGAEITTFDALDESLRSAQGSVYLAIKTWCANLLLTAYFQQHNDQASAQRAYNMAHRTAQTLAAAFNADTKLFPANLYKASDAAVIAILDPMAIPAFCGLSNYFEQFPELVAKLKEHAATCLQRGKCLDETNGGLKLTSTSTNTWPSKLVMVSYVLEHVLGVNLAEYPTVFSEMLHWLQISSAETTLADQIDVAGRTVKGATYYPRLASAAIWLRPPQAAEQTEQAAPPQA